MKQLLLACMTLCLSITLCAQVTTATLIGTVNDDAGDPLIAATVLAVHAPSGTQYGITTREDGDYTLPNLRVGGPYTITVSYVGYESDVVQDIYLTLGQKRTMDFSLTTGSQQLGEVVITGESGAIISKDRTGASTNIGSDQLTQLPTISRSASDFTRLTPASDGNSFGGRNDQFNNFSLDGSIFNNPFGLDAATPGGQTESQPISLDAIDQISVDIAPYDVTQSGFTGAAVNAVTKSGTNELHGTVFGFFRNDGLTGSKVEGNDVTVADLDQLQYGFSLGGPIIKNKLFFFINAEIDNRDDLGTTWIPSGANASGQVSRVTMADMTAVANALQSIGYDPGAPFGYIHESNSTKGIVKLDFAINQSNTLTATYNFLDADKDKPAHPSAIGRRGPDFTTLQFENSGYQINNVVHSGILEWRSVFGNKFANKLQVGYTRFEDSRNPFSEPIPVININNNDNIRYIVAGHEPFSIHNRLDQDVFQFTNNFNIYSGDHTITLGTSFERFNFDNSFNLGTYDPFTYGGGTFGPGFASVQAFVDTVNAGGFADELANAQNVFAANGGDNGVEGEGWALAETNIGQWGIYVQDEWQATENLNLTLGVRVDVPLYFNTSDLIAENIARNCCHVPDIQWADENGDAIIFDHTELPKGNVQISPRLGFNLDVNGDQSTQIRGGSGLFTGRLPFVWIGNHVANPNIFFYNVTRTDFKFPQVWRTNVGVDKTFGEGWIGTVDLMYTKDIEAPYVRNYGLRPPTGTLQGPDNRAIYTADDRVVDAFTNAYVFSNTDIGYSFNASVQVSRQFDANTHLMLGYNYLKAEDASSIEAEISSDAYDRNPAGLGNVNIPVGAPSLYGAKHRFIGSFYKTWTYGNGENMRTTIGAFFSYAEGGTTQNDNTADFRYSYTYSGDINGDGSGLNDLLYIPTDAELDQQQFASNSEREAFRQYIQQDEYLSENRGAYAEKYAILAPWYSQWDLKIMQEFAFNAGAQPNRVQVSVDILNVGNLISSDWGVRQLPNNTQPVGVSVDGDGVPTYSFDENLTSTYSADFGLLSRWQAQIGLRYIF